MPLDIKHTIDFDNWYKFRAWDELCNVMHYDVEYMLIKNGEDVLGMIYQSDIHEHKFDQWPPESEYESKLLLMEYIKAKDINGKKIYHQDFVKVTDSGIVFIGYVMFGNGGCPIAFDVENEKDKKQRSVFFDNREITFEVIGNKYENPDIASKIDWLFTK